MVHYHPVETLKDLLPPTAESILSKAEESLRLADDRGDLELIWELNVFCVLLRANGETLLVYRTSIRDVLQRCRRILHRESNRLVALAIERVLQLLVEVYIVNSPSNDPTLPIRVSRCLSLSSVDHQRSSLFRRGDKPRMSLNFKFDFTFRVSTRSTSLWI